MSYVRVLGCALFVSDHISKFQLNWKGILAIRVCGIHNDVYIVKCLCNLKFVYLVHVTFNEFGFQLMNKIVVLVKSQFLTVPGIIQHHLKYFKFISSTTEKMMIMKIVKMQSTRAE